MQLLLLAMQTNSPHCGRESYLYSGNTLCDITGDKRCGWPLPGEAPGKEELASKVNHRYYTLQCGWPHPREAPGKEEQLVR